MIEENQTPEFREVPGFPGYVVSSAGEVLSFRGGKFAGILSPRKTTTGYFGVCLRTDSGETIQKRVHQLVLETFVGPRPEGQVCRHLNNNKEDNRLSNLTWGTYQENTQDCIDAGTHYRFPHANGEMVGTARLTAEHVVKILTSTEPSRKLAKLLGVGKTTILRVRNRVTWAHVNLPA